MKSAIAIITYNRLETLKTLRAGLDKHCTQYPRAIFEDCGLRDETATKLKAEFTEVGYRHEYLATHHKKDELCHAFLGTKNIGVSGNSNRALKWFMEETDAEHLCLMNDDLEVMGDFVKAYYDAHCKLNMHLFCHCDFTSETYKWVPIQVRSADGTQFTLKLLPRMTGIMMSLTRNLVEKIGYFDTTFGKWGEEHSQPAGSLVLMSDYTQRPIETVKAGDIVIGWHRPEKRPYNPPKGSAWHINHDEKFVWDRLCKTRIMGVHPRQFNVTKLTLESGKEILCTPDHKWLPGIHPERGYRRAEVGIPLLKVTSTHDQPNITNGYKMGYIKGALECDGTNNNHLRVTNEKFAKRFAQYAAEFFDITTRDDYVVENKKFGYENILWSVYLKGGTETREKIKQWKPRTYHEMRGWLAGIYDAEGCNNSIGQSKQVNPETYDRICKTLGYFNFKFHFTNQEHEILIDGGRSEILRFMALAQPALPEKADKIILRGKFKDVHDKVIKIEDMGEMTVYSLQTESGNYIADGYASSNCDITNRARFSGGMRLQNQDLHCVDVEMDPPLLKHQEVESCILPQEKAGHDAVAYHAMQKASKLYGCTSWYRPFRLHTPEFTGAYENCGIPVEKLTHLPIMIQGP